MTFWDSVPALSEENFWREVTAHPVAVVLCWAAWSQPDLALAGLLEKVRPEYASIVFFAANIAGDGAEVAKWFEEYRTPTLLCFLNGQHHATSVGYLRPDQLRLKLNEWVDAST